MADLISRSYILKIIEMWMKVPSYSESERNIMRALYYEVRTAPSAQQWVPVSERLPSYGEDVLLSIGRYVNVGYLVQVSDDDGQYNWFYSGWYHPLSEVDAWLPLPEPYERGDSE